MSIKHKKITLTLLFFALFSISAICRTFSQNTEPSPNLITERNARKTSFQQVGKYDSRYDLKTDLVMVYGVSDEALANIREWKEKSDSEIAVMTGIAWGEYGDYLNGNFDGIDHWDDAQVKSDDQRMQHDPATPYLSPSVAFSNYLETRLKKVVDAGVDEIYLEEPEFWAFTGFGKSFQREWQIFYNEPFIRPNTTCDSQYRASKLKQYLYRRALDRVATSLKEYSLKTYNRPLTVNVATHSLISYAQIQMVSPESSLLDLAGVDGLIAQIWTGTSRFGNFYNGTFAERTFETALLEYSVMQEMTRGTNKRVYFLNDPVEDDPNHDWDDYQRNYFSTLVASLICSDTCYYEVAPWPSRVFLGSYPTNSPNATRIPPQYASTLTLLFQQLRDMQQTETSWLTVERNIPRSDDALSNSVGILIADSSMFQRAAPTTDLCAVEQASDPARPTKQEISSFCDFLGLSIPLLKRGIPVEAPVLDNTLRFPNYLDKYRTLVLSYDFQKPSSPGIHSALVDWVSRGGVLIFVNSEQDPYNQVKEWWNTGLAQYDSPSEHLLTSLGLEKDQGEGQYQFGSGWVFIERKRPSFYTRSFENGNDYYRLVSEATLKNDLQLKERNYLLKQRGPYLLAAVMTESENDSPLVLEGNYVNLFDPNLRVIDKIELAPGDRALLLDLNKVSGEVPLVLASSCRIEAISTDTKEKTIKINATSPTDIEAICLLKLENEPRDVKINNESPQTIRWNEQSKTLFFSFHTSDVSIIDILE